MLEMDLDTARWAIIGGCVLFAAFWYRGDIAGFAKRLVPSGGKTATSSLQEAAGSVLSIRGYFGAIGCKEGVEAANKCWECLVHEVNPEHKA